MVTAYSANPADVARLAGATTSTNDINVGPMSNGAFGMGVGTIAAYFLNEASSDNVLAFGFRDVKATAGTIKDRAWLYGFANETNYFDFYAGSSPKADMYGSDYHAAVTGFHYIGGFAETPNDQATFHGGKPKFYFPNWILSNGTGYGDGSYDLAADGFANGKVLFG